MTEVSSKVVELCRAYFLVNSDSPSLSLCDLRFRHDRWIGSWASPTGLGQEEVRMKM